MKRREGIEPSFSGWRPEVLPLNYILAWEFRKKDSNLHRLGQNQMCCHCTIPDRYTPPTEQKSREVLRRPHGSFPNANDVENYAGGAAPLPCCCCCCLPCGVEVIFVSKARGICSGLSATLRRESTAIIPGLGPNSLAFSRKSADFAARRANSTSVFPRIDDELHGCRFWSTFSGFQDQRFIVIGLQAIKKPRGRCDLGAGKTKGGSVAAIREIAKYGGGTAAPAAGSYLDPPRQTQPHRPPIGDR